MKAISRALDRFCYNHPRLGIPELMQYIALGNVFVFIVDLLTGGMASAWLAFYPGLIGRRSAGCPGRRPRSAGWRRW